MTHLPAHGTYSRYVSHACRCNPCRDAGRTYRRRLGYDQANGISRRIDRTQTVVHLERLIARGWNQKQIAAAAGLNNATISEALSGRYATVHRNTATAILGITLDQRPPIPRRVVDATGTRRRLQALAVLGHPMADVARQAGVGVSSLQQTADGRWDAIRATTAQKVARVYRQLSTTPAPRTLWSEKARNHAMAHGWYGPMAWDDIDDPACQPDPDAPSAPAHVRPKEVRELAARGLDDERIGRRLGLSPRTVLRARTAHNIPTGAAALAKRQTRPAAVKPSPKKREPAKCGTRAGYQKHLREKTEICAPCRQANTDADNRLRRTGTTKVPPKQPATLAEAFEQHTTHTDDGHVLWYGAKRMQFQGTAYNALRLAFTTGHGREPEGPVRRTCGKDCYLAEHLTDAVIRDALAVCGTLPGYARHLKRGEVTCGPCRGANAGVELVAS